MFGLQTYRIIGYICMKRHPYNWILWFHFFFLCIKANTDEMMALFQKEGLLTNTGLVEAKITKCTFFRVS